MRKAVEARRMGSLEIWVLILALPLAYCVCLSVCLFISLFEPQFTCLYSEEIGLFQLRHPMVTGSEAWAWRLGLGEHLGQSQAWVRARQEVRPGVQLCPQCFPLSCSQTQSVANSLPSIRSPFLSPRDHFIGPVTGPPEPLSRQCFSHTMVEFRHAA